MFIMGLCYDLVHLTVVPKVLHRTHLRGGGDAERVMAAAHDLRDQRAAEHADEARLDPGHLRALALPALPLVVAAPGDDLVRGQRHRVLQ